jgi:hypothetical protein
MSSRAAARLDEVSVEVEGAFDGARQQQQAEIIRLAEIQQQQQSRPDPIEEMMVQQMMDGSEGADIEVARETARKILAKERVMYSASGQQQQQQRGPMWQKLDQIRHVGVRLDLDQ